MSGLVALVVGGPLAAVGAGAVGEFALSRMPATAHLPLAANAVIGYTTAVLVMDQMSPSMAFDHVFLNLPMEYHAVGVAGALAGAWATNLLF